MLDVRSTHDVALVVEDLLGFEAVTNSAVIETFLNAIIGFCLAELCGPTKLFMLHAPPFDGADAYVEELG